MTTAESDAEVADALAALARDIDRVADRLRSMALTRLAGPAAAAGPSQSRAAVARELAQRLEDHAAAVERRAAQRVPVLADAAAGDQVAVTGADLLAAARSAATDPAVAGEVSRALEELRQARAVL